MNYPCTTERILSKLEREICSSSHFMINVSKGTEKHNIHVSKYVRYSHPWQQTLNFAITKRHTSNTNHFLA
jgi:hypothetical protein